MSKLVSSTEVELIKLPDSEQDSHLIESRRKGFLTLRRMMFAVIVLLPSLVAAIYYGIYASDVYVTEARFVIRASTPKPSIGLPDGADGLSIAGMDMDVAIVNTFINSPDAVAMLMQNARLKQAYSAPYIDSLSKFPGVLWENTAEDLFEYYSKMVSLKFDKSTQITTLKVKAFSPEDAYRIAQALLDGSEALVNRLSERMKTDLISKSERDQIEAEIALREVQYKLAAWRKANDIVDPTSYSKVVGDVITRLSLQLATLESRLEQLRKNTPNNPAIQQAALSAKVVKKQIDEEWDKLSGRSGSLTAAIGEYEQLMVEYQVAQKIYSISKASTAQAKAKVQQRETYLVAVAKPQLPTVALYPKRISNSILVCIVAILVFLILDKIAHNISRHGTVSKYTSFKRAS